MTTCRATTPGCFHLTCPCQECVSDRAEYAARQAAVDELQDSDAVLEDERRANGGTTANRFTDFEREYLESINEWEVKLMEDLRW